MGSACWRNDAFDKLYVRDNVPLQERGKTGLNWYPVLRKAAELSQSRVVGDTVCVKLIDIVDFLPSGVNWSVADAVQRSVNLDGITEDIKAISDLAFECLFLGGKLVVSEDKQSFCCEWLPREAIYIGGDNWLLLHDYSRWNDDRVDVS